MAKVIVITAPALYPLFQFKAYQTAVNSPINFPELTCPLGGHYPYHCTYTHKVHLVQQLVQHLVQLFLFLKLHS